MKLIEFDDHKAADIRQILYCMYGMTLQFPLLKLPERIGLDA